MIRRPPRSTPLYSSAASDVYKRQVHDNLDVCYRLSVTVAALEFCEKGPSNACSFPSPCPPAPYLPLSFLPLLSPSLPFRHDLELGLLKVIQGQR